MLKNVFITKINDVFINDKKRKKWNLKEKLLELTNEDNKTPTFLK